MQYFKISSSAAGLAFLAACSTTTPTIPDVPTVGVASNSGGTYAIVTDGATHTMTGPSSSLSGNMLAWYGGSASATMKGAGFETADVLALSAMNIAGPNETFAGISGTLGTVPTSGTATYDTNIRMQLLEPTQVHMFGLPGMSITADFGAATVAGTGNYNTAVQGNIVGSQFTGTASIKGLVNSTVTTVPMQGGFYGTNGGTIAGVFAGPGLAGVFGGHVVP